MRAPVAYSPILGLLFVSSVCAQTPSSDNQPSWAEYSYHRVNESLQATANWLDYFFADERFEEEQAWTRLKLQWTTSGAEGEGFASDFRLRGKVILPNLGRRWQLVFEGDPETGDITGLNKDEESSAAIRYVAKEGLARRLSFDAGIGGGFRDPSFRTKVQYRMQKESAPWLHRLRPVIEYDSRDGWQSYISNDNERKFSDTVYFRSSTTPRWREDTDGYLLSQDFTLFKQLGARRYLAFDWLNSFVTKPHRRLDATRLRLRYRREIWQDKLFLELGPGVGFLAENHHEVKIEGFLRFELLFEKKPPPTTPTDRQ